MTCNFKVKVNKLIKNSRKDELETYSESTLYEQNFEDIDIGKLVIFLNSKEAKEPTAGDRMELKEGENNEETLQ